MKEVHNLEVFDIAFVLIALSSLIPRPDWE